MARPVTAIVRSVFANSESNLISAESTDYGARIVVDGLRGSDRRRLGAHDIDVGSLFPDGVSEMAVHLHDRR